MRKLLLISDTHLGLQNSIDLWHDVTIHLFQEVTDFCLTNDIDTILHLGDFFHVKTSTNHKTLDVAYQIAKITSSLKMIIITGNHDIYYKEQIYPSSLKYFEDLDHIEVIKKPTVIDDYLCLIPWGCEIPNEGHFCFGHFEINGFHQNNTSVCKNDKLTIESFKRFIGVYSGHFHTPSSQKNISYIGSAFPQTFHDVNSPRGYYVFDNGDLEFIEYKSAPKFIELHTEKELNNIEGNIVKVVFDKDYGTNQNEKIIENIEKQNPIRLIADFSKIENKELEDDSEDFSMVEHDTIIKSWIKSDKNIPEHLNKRTLENMIMKLKEES